MSIRHLPPDTVDRGTCKRCRRSIRFVKLHNGKRIPVNPEKTPTGRLAATYNTEAAMWIGGHFIGRAEADEPIATDRFDPHSDTCR